MKKLFTEERIILNDRFVVIDNLLTKKHGFKTGLESTPEHYLGSYTVAIHTTYTPTKRLEIKYSHMAIQEASMGLKGNLIASLWISNQENKNSDHATKVEKISLDILIVEQRGEVMYICTEDMTYITWEEVLKRLDTIKTILENEDPCDGFKKSQEEYIEIISHVSLISKNLELMNYLTTTDPVDNAQGRAFTLALITAKKPEHDLERPYLAFEHVDDQELFENEILVNLVIKSNQAERTGASRIDCIFLEIFFLRNGVTKGVEYIHEGEKITFDELIGKFTRILNLF